jgi:hypothetical protein
LSDMALRLGAENPQALGLSREARSKTQRTGMHADQPRPRQALGERQATQAWMQRIIGVMQAELAKTKAVKQELNSTERVPGG